MHPDERTSTPAGWYPDPAGTPQWRVWNGREWSQLTKPFHVAAPTAPLQAAPEAPRALRQLRTVGVPAFFAGLALLLGTVAHWPGNGNATSATWAQVAGTASIGLLALGVLQFAYVVRILQGYWSADAFVPGLNILSVNVLLARILRVKAFGSPPLVEVFILGFSLVAFREPLVVALLLATLARTYIIRLGIVAAMLDEAGPQ